MFRRISCALLALLMLFGLLACDFRPSAPETYVPETTVPATSEPRTTAPQTTEPQTTEPVTSEPMTTEPITTEPITTEPITTEPETQPTPPPAPADATVSFVAAGDNMIFKGNWLDAARGQASGQYDFTKMYKNVKNQISSADLAFINQETLLCGEGYELSAYPHFNGPQQAGLDLLTVGFDIINMANNRMADQGEQGLKDAIRFWKSATDNQNSLMIGGYENEEDYDTVRIIEKNGIKIAFVAFTYTTGEKFSESEPVLPLYNQKKLESQIAAAKAAADFVIVSAHWGGYNALTVNAKQKEIAKVIADCGADVIIGSHSHALQPIEWIEGKNGGKTLCAYSLGNFLAEQDNDYNILGGLLTFELAITDGQKEVRSVGFTPTVCHYGKDWKNVIYYLSDYTDELGEAHAVNTYYDNGAVTLEALNKLYHDAIDTTRFPDNH